MNNSNLDSYRQELRARLDGGMPSYGLQQQPQTQPMAQPQTQPMAQPMEQPAMEGAAKSTAPIESAKQAPPKLKFDNKKLQNVTDVGSIIDAAESKSLNSYLNWYDKQVADINSTYDRVISEMGGKPGSGKKMSKKEKFTMLMEFGLNLIKSSQGKDNTAAGTMSAFANAAGATIEGQKTKGLEYDARVADVNQQRQGALRGLGSRSEAVRAQASLDEAANRDSDVVAQVRTDRGLMGRTRSGKLVPMLDPESQEIAQPDETSGNVSPSRYLQEKNDLIKVFMNEEGLSREKAEIKAIKELRKKGSSSVNHIKLRQQAFSRARQTLGTQSNYYPSDYGGKSYDETLNELADAEYQNLLSLAEKEEASPSSGGSRRVYDPKTKTFKTQ